MAVNCRSKDAIKRRRRVNACLRLVVAGGHKCLYRRTSGLSPLSDASDEWPSSIVESKFVSAVLFVRPCTRWKMRDHVLAFPLTGYDIVL